MIDVRLMQAAVAVAEELSFSRAAARLGITQSALTKQIQDLEERVGRELFRRNKQGVEITEAGQAFVEEARRALLYAERAVLSARGRSEDAEAVLRLGRSPHTDPFLVSTALSVRLPLYPALKLNLSSNYPPMLTNQLFTSCLDVALVNGLNPPPGLSSTQIASAPLYVAFAAEDFLARRPEVQLSDLNDRRWVVYERHVNPPVYDGLQRSVAFDSVVPKDMQHVSTAEEAIPLIVELGSIAFLTRSDAWRIARDGITMRALADERLCVKTYLTARPEDESRLVSEFVRTLVRKLKNLVQPTQERLPLAI